MTVANLLEIWSGFGRRAIIASLMVFACLAAAPAATANDEEESFAGQLLVARPAMADTRFAESVIFLVQHDADGALGVMVNRPVADVSLGDLMRSLGLDEDAEGRSLRVHYGGPVEQSRGFFLHSPDYAADGTIIVADVGFTDRPDILRDMARDDGPSQSLFALGYSGWGPGQLEAEIDEGAWDAVPLDDALIFDEDHEDKWGRARALRTLDL